MGIQSSLIFYTACDKCKDAIGGPEWLTETDARESAIKLGWKIDDGHIFCPGCWKTRWNIEGVVEKVQLCKDGSGELILENKNDNSFDYIKFTNAPKDIEILKGLKIWGHRRSLLVEKCTFAKRIGYKEIEITCSNFNWCRKEKMEG